MAPSRIYVQAVCEQGRGCWGLTSFACDRLSLPNGLADARVMYDINDRAHEQADENVNGATKGGSRGCGVDQGDAEAVRRLRSRQRLAKLDSGVRAERRDGLAGQTRPLPTPQPWHRSGQGSPVWFRSRRSRRARTSHIASVGPSQRSSVHLIHGAAAASHKRLKRSRPDRGRFHGTPTVLPPAVALMSVGECERAGL